MSTTEAPAALPGGDATKGRFEWFHNACGTIYADTVDDAIACAYHRILDHDPGHAAGLAIHVQRVGYNAAHGTDWQAPDPAPQFQQGQPALLAVAVPGGKVEHVRQPDFEPAPVPAATPDDQREPPAGSHVAPAGTLPANPDAPNFG